jgi:segregation and condensation protein A
MTKSNDYKVKLEVFEGPLDLLLHLVKKHELAILDIPVSFITEKYLQYLELMRQMNLDVAGEYLLMAATLAHIKSRELLPPSPHDVQDAAEEGDEDLDPRQELIKRLLEYQKYKEAAVSLGDRPVVGRNVFTRGGSIGDDVERVEAPLAEVPVFKLLEALSDIMSNARVKLTHDVIIERLTITDRINQLVDRLEHEGTFTFQSCFSFVNDEQSAVVQVKHEVVVTFLAILEMTRIKLIRISQPDGAAEIYITRAVEDVRGVARSSTSEDYR